MKKIFKKVLKMLTSRYFISTLLILFEVCMIYYIEGILNSFIYFYIFSVVISYICLIAIINKDWIYEVKLPWVIAILAFSPFGTVLYLIFGIRQLSFRERKFYKELEKNIFVELESDTFKTLKQDDLKAYQKAYSLASESNNELYQNTTCTYYPNGECFFDEYLDLLKGAKHFIFIEYFIISEGMMLDRIISILTQKVKEGVEVYFMYDDMGSLFSIDGNFYKKLNQLGIKAQCFAKYTGKANSSHNNRNHRKITVIDGKIAYTGGINLADEYINAKKRFGYWKDSVIKIEGLAVKDMIEIFLFDWDLNSKTKTDPTKYFSLVSKVNGFNGYYLPFGTGPRHLYKPDIAKNAYLNLINQAEHYVYLTTPYLIIDNEMTNSLCNAAKRGVDVRIITPFIPDKKIANAITKSNYMPLLNAGVKIYEYEPGFIHAKNFIVDDLYAICGTINFDYRSLIHHYENAVWMYKSEAIVDMKDDFLDTVNKSILQNKESAKQNIVTKILLSLMKAFFPLF